MCEIVADQDRRAVMIYLNGKWNESTFEVSVDDAHVIGNKTVSKEFPTHDEALAVYAGFAGANPDRWSNPKLRMVIDITPKEPA